MKSTLAGQQICFYGAGSIAEAIVRGILDKHIADPEQITMMNRNNQERLSLLEQKYHVHTTNDVLTKERVLREASIIVLAMKPKDAAEALEGLRSLLHPQQLIISVIAGLSVGTMQELLAATNPIVRTMPNTSSTIGLGATGMCFSTNVNAIQQQIALAMFEAIGVVSVVEEAQMDMVTGVSGSGPAYVYLMMESMIEAGIKGGLSEEQAKNLTVQTILGAASMVQLTGENPAELRRKVTSPGGTTQAAIETLQANQFTEVMIQAVHRAAARAGEMGALIGRETHH
ncbi:pyrroline-5-carboxylate reductase [Paenibacillus selenitireducens]|uniref:Pyrroline-5-carboxylate reductase n=1 Tax=Paenibacillus selenitireducens TaxID=1324314 RepID=A0A1T2WZ91_9BACL|nr:pyrroline-5-carboxylate reductase [Paenibacillus selenitireducens]OPA72891.1 pyrroline-5-carboxylate reductase [Paenibacillus selenitireducens]